jgi:hypothetical protein
VTQQETTKANINKLIEFRQAVYENGISARRDAIFDLLDALLTESPVASFAMLSQSSHFPRKWPSLYAAVEDGEIDSQWLRTYLARQVPQQGVCVFPIDGSPWPRPRSRVLDDRQYIYQASSAVNGGTLTVGYPYSLLEWCVEPHTSWCLPVDPRRVASTQTAQEVGVEQIQALAEARSDYLQALDIVAADGKYGHCGFLRPLKGLRCGIVARLRCDRVLYGPPPLRIPHQKGRPRVHGARFAFKEPETWGTPGEVIELEDEHWGKVRLERWAGLHEKKGADVPYEVIRACVHLEREKPPAALWLAWSPPARFPASLTVTGETIWRAYISRWPVEAGIHFRKETLGWTLPRFQTKAAGDRWTELTALACWMIYLARPIVADTPLPWQKLQPHLTPQRVQQSIRPIFALIGSPARSPKLRGIGSGWPKGRQRTPKLRFAVVKKTPVAAKTA